MVSRSGAVVLGEFTVFGLPSILIPYPYAWRYQKVNADYLANRGAAIYMDESTMGEVLLPTVLDLLKDTNRLEAMKTAARTLARPDAAKDAAKALLELAGGRA